MIFTRISKQLTASNWKPVLLEFVIVVIGVFIGIQAANWNELRADRDREKVYLERLDADFDVITARLEGGKQVFRESAEGIQLLINARLVHEGKQSGECRTIRC